MIHLLTLISAPAFAVPVDATLDANPDAIVTIYSECGTLKVVGKERSSVHVHGDAPEGAFTFDGRTGRIRVRAEQPPKAKRTNRSSACSDLVIEVPRGASLEIESISSGVTVESVEGPIEVEGVSGDLRISGTPASVEADLVSGQVTLTGAMSSVDVDTVSGGVILDGLRGQVKADSVSGSIELRGGKLDRAKLNAVSGDIILNAAYARDARIEAKTHSGGVRLRVPKKLGANYVLETFSGDIRGDLGAPVVRPEHGPGASCEFSVGDGGAAFEIEAFSGSIKIDRP